MSKKKLSWLNKGSKRTSNFKPPRHETLEKLARQAAKSGLITDRDTGTIRYAPPKR